MTVHATTDASSLPRPTHSGNAHLSAGTIFWKESAHGEVIFERADDAVPVSFKALELSADDQLRLVNQLLAFYRSHALPNGGKYYASSIGISRNGGMFINVNNELAIKDEFAGRGCAETSVLSDTQKAEGHEDVMFDYVYLMSGQAKRDTLKRLVDIEPGHMGCLCGECRRNLRPHTDEGTKFVMLRTNDGQQEFTVNRTAESMKEVGKDEAWEISYAKMYPVERTIPLGEGTNELVKQGYLYVRGLSPTLPMISNLPEVTDEDRARGAISVPIHDYEKLTGHFHIPDRSIPALNENPSLENINRFLTLTIKEAYKEHQGVNDLSISVVVVKTNDGKFYSGIRIDGEKVPAKPNAAIDSLALNKKGVAEAYIMKFDEKQLLEELHATNGGSTEGHQCPVADPADLGRVLKNCLPSDNPKITMVPLNNGTLRNDELHDLTKDLSMDVRKSFGPDFANPKRCEHVQGFGGLQ